MSGHELAAAAPCPFCGGVTLAIAPCLVEGRLTGLHRVLCFTCTAGGPAMSSEAGAVEVWNRRQPADSAWRIAVALKVARALRYQLVCGVPYGSTTGNIQSIIDCLVLPLPLLMKQACFHADLLPDAELVAQIEKNWRREFTQAELFAGEHVPPGFRPKD